MSSLGAETVPEVDAVVSPPGEARAPWSWTGLVALVFLASVWGCLNVYQAQMHSATPGHFAGRQLAWLVLGMLVLAGASSVPFAYWRRWLPGLAVVVYLTLWLVLVLGVRRQGMRGWFEVGPCLVQPSEFAKPVLVLLLCHLALRRATAWQLAGVAALWILPVLLQPDFGTAAVFVAVLFLCMILGEMPLRQVGLVLGVLVLGVALAALRHDYVMARLTGFLDPAASPLGHGWHGMQFRLALARGGLGGVGWGHALWSHAFLPLAHSDSAYAAMGEALGLAGCLPALLLFPLLAWLGCRLSVGAGDPLARLYMRTFAFTVAVQGLVHLGVNVGLLPITGVTLPFLSYGGSSLISLMLGIGILGSAMRADREGHCPDGGGDGR